MTASPTPAHPHMLTPGGLHVPDLADDIGALDAALAYAAAGWYVIPIKRGTKHPGSVLGRGWQQKSTRDPETIVGHWAGTDHGVALHVGRSGAVALDIDRPDQVPDDMATALRTVPRAPKQTTRRGEPRRGHLLFTTPPGRTIGNGLGTLPQGWGDIRGANGIIVVAPSTHPDPDGHYQWDRTGVLPLLPEWIADRLTTTGASVAAATDAAVRDALTAWTRASRPETLRAVLAEWDREVRGNGGSRHNTAIKLTCWAAREARGGLYPLTTALTQLRAKWDADITRPLGDGRTLTPSEAASEWAGIVAWAVGNALAEPDENITSRVVRATAAMDTAGGLGLTSAPDAAGDPQLVTLPSGTAFTPDPTPHEELQAEEDAVFGSHPVLEHMRAYARWRMVSPWAMLGSVIAQVGAAHPWTTRVTSGVADTANLALIVMLTGKPGSGKGQADKAAADWLHLHPTITPRKRRSIRSAEGIVHIHARNTNTQELTNGADKADPTTAVPDARTSPDGRGLDPDTALLWKTREACIVITEVDMLTAQRNRTGDKTSSYLRQAWSEEILGGAAATSERDVELPAKSYTTTFVIHAQPERCATLVGGESLSGGLAQRITWFDAHDRLMPDTDTPDPGPIPDTAWDGGLFPEGHGAGPGTSSLIPATTRPDPIFLGLPATAIAEVTAYRRHGARYGHPEGTEHEPLMQVRVAACLALTAAHGDVTDWSWETAGHVLTHHRRIREDVRQAVAQAGHKETVATGRRQGRIAVEAAAVVAAGKSADEDTVRATVLQALREAAGQPVRVRTARDAVTSRLRGLFPEVIRGLAEEGVIEETEVLTSPNRKADALLLKA